MMFALLLITLVFASDSSGAQSANRGKVYSVYFDAACQMPVYKVKTGYESVAKTIKWSVGTVPEGMQLVGAISLLGDRFGLSQSQAEDLRSGFSKSYRAIDGDPECTGVSSVLDEIFATDPNRQGHYFVYVPTKVSTAAPTILFLHGYGGNFQYYIWSLKEAFPESVIIAPTWGIGWHDGRVDFVDDVCQHVKERFNLALGKKWLMGLSAGGPAGFRLMNTEQHDFQGYICIASAVATERVADMSFSEPILMLNGIYDVRFPIQFVRRSVAEMKMRGLSVEQLELEQDHFFLLNQRAETFRIIEAFIERHSLDQAIALNNEKPHWVVKFLSPWGLACLGLSVVCFLTFIKLRSQRKQLL